jgi:hypothetical protein
MKLIGDCFICRHLMASLLVAQALGLAGWVTLGYYYLTQY